LGWTRNRPKNSAKNNITPRREMLALWEQQQDVHKGFVVPMSELRAQVTEAVKARRMRKAKTRANQKSSKQLENCLEQE
jgi:hypothetical protein